MEMSSSTLSTEPISHFAQETWNLAEISAFQTAKLKTSIVPTIGTSKASRLAGIPATEFNGNNRKCENKFLEKMGDT
jgi:hypothetical protein